MVGIMSEEIERTARAMRRLHGSSTIAECKAIIARFRKRQDPVGVETWEGILAAVRGIEQERRLIE
jgi:hypothetical protein